MHKNGLAQVVTIIMPLWHR